MPRRTLPVRVETTSELMRAVARDFENRQMEASARERLRQRLADVSGAGQRMRLEPAPDGGMRAVLYGPYLREPSPVRTLEKQRQVDQQRERLEHALRRPRAQPAKYPELDAAMIAAVSRGESPSAVVDAALAALRVAHPETQPKELRAKFLDRLKKKRRTLSY